MSNLKMVVPDEMLRKKGMEVEVEALETERARIMADPTMPDWKKKLAQTSISHQVKEIKLRNKQAEYQEMKEGM